MTASDLLRRVYATGVTLSIVDGDRLQLRGRPCPDDLKAELIANKPAVLAALRDHRIGERSPNSEIEMPIRFIAPCSNVTCPHLGPCRWYLDSGTCSCTVRKADAA